MRVDILNPDSHAAALRAMAPLAVKLPATLARAAEPIPRNP